MKFEQEVTLIGVVGKKGNGKLDNGQEWSTDRVELHCIAPFSESDSMAFGDTATVYQVQDFNANYDKAKQCVGQPIKLQMTMEAAKKLGGAPKIVCVGFSPAKQQKAVNA